MRPGTRRLNAIALLVGFAGLTSSCAFVSKVDLWRAVADGRDGWQHPEAVIEALAIQPGDRVAEIGAGDGYWIGWLSKAVGPTGRVYAVEVDDAKIAILSQRVAQEGLSNVEVVRGEYADPGLPDAGIDLAITCLTYHHIEDRVVYFHNLKRDLSSRGRVAHLDDRDDLPGLLGYLPTEGHWSNVEQMNAEMSSAGYVRAEKFDFLPVQSFQIFTPASSRAAEHASGQ